MEQDRNEGRETRRRSPETLTSDISNSVCSQLQRRNHGKVESPIALLLRNDQGPPGVIYDRSSVLPIDPSVSFQTSYSAAMTEANTTKTSTTTYSADMTETDSQGDVEHKASANGDQENSGHRSVIHQHDDNEFEVGYKEHSSARSKGSCEVGRSREARDSGENNSTPDGVHKTPTESNSARAPVLPSTNSRTSSNDKSGAPAAPSLTLSTALKESNKASSKSTSSGKRFLSRGFAKRVEKKTNEQDFATADPTSLALADGSRDDNISLFENGLEKFQDVSTEEDNAPNAMLSLKNKPLIWNDNMLETQQDNMHQYGFEITDIKHSSTSGSECKGMLSVLHSSRVPQAYTKSTGEEAHGSSEITSAINSENSSKNDDALVEVLKSTAGSNPAIECRNRPVKNVEQDDHSTVQSILSHLTLSTDAPTEASFTSSSTYLRRSSQPKRSNKWLFAKMFACGPSSTSCDPVNIQKQCYSPIEEDGDSDELSYESDEEERVQKQRHSLSLADQDFDESLNIEVPLESATYGAEGNNKSFRTKVTSRMIAKAHFCPGFEVADEEGKAKVTTNSKSGEIREIVRKLSIGQKLNRRKKKKEAQPKKQSAVESLVPRRKPTRGTETGSSERRTKSILERIDIQVS